MDTCNTRNQAQYKSFNTICNGHTVEIKNRLSYLIRSFLVILVINFTHKKSDKLTLHAQTTQKYEKWHQIIVCPFSFGHCVNLSVLQFTDFDYPFGIFKLFFEKLVKNRMFCWKSANYLYIQAGWYFIHGLIIKPNYRLHLYVCYHILLIF